jgi:hypothetical protein
MKKEFLLVAAFMMSTASAVAEPKQCYSRAGGVYAAWQKSSSYHGTGAFSVPAPNAARMPNFTWRVTGAPDSVRVHQNEVFDGGNTMEPIYGEAEPEQNLNVRIESNGVEVNNIIPHSAVVTITFDQVAPASGWAFAVTDLDVDQVQIRAIKETGGYASAKEIDSWFVQRFDANPEEDGPGNIPSWDPANSAVVGSESSSKTWRTKVEGYLEDSEAGAAWFQPNVALRKLIFEYKSLQREATPSFHVFLASCVTVYPTPIPTPSLIGDTDVDGITDEEEGRGDPDNDEIPNYYDRDSDNDNIPDAVEGGGDTDGDGTPNSQDGDSDNDGVQDQIERDAEDTFPDPSGTDADRDGVDDAVEPEILEPVDDSDSDGTPDVVDQDSDNDGTPDTREAFDLDGDGDQDVTPTGVDDDGDGVDDAFDRFTSVTDINDAGAETVKTPPCTSSSLVQQKRDVRRRMQALYERVPKFVSRAAACGAASQESFRNDAILARRSFEKLMATSFLDQELSCPTVLCPRVKRDIAKRKLNRAAQQLARYARTAKLKAIAACKVVEPPNKKPDNRPRTEDYFRALQGTIAKLPNHVSRCSQ